MSPREALTVMFCARDADIYLAFDGHGNGGRGVRRGDASLRLVGQAHGITPERVRQIYIRVSERLQTKGGKLAFARLCSEPMFFENVYIDDRILRCDSMVSIDRLKREDHAEKHINYLDRRRWGK